MTKATRIAPELCVHDAAAALEFYKHAFGAEERKRMPGPDGKRIVHAELVIGAHRLVVFDEFNTAEGGTLRCPRTLGGPACVSSWRSPVRKPLSLRRFLQARR